ncbi:MAG: hypothetical protein LQ345_007115 [Seirophora villosa]|nr:MAG: hypothetical protein LQ345_007115 [Seirophora villosa]
MSTPTTFSLADRGLKLDTADQTREHTQPLSASTTHTTILLNGNTFGPSACTHLSPLLSSQIALSTINLADIFTSRLLAEIPPALSSLLTSLLPLRKLQTVDLSDNAFGLNTQAPLVEFLRKHVPLRVLVLNNNGLGPEAGALIADALCELADKKAEARKEEGAEAIPSLETVICGRNRLESGSMKAWSRAFTKNKDIKVVKMVQNGIRQPGIEVLLQDGLAGCANLEVLDLQDNTFTDVGARALARAVPGWKALRELGVGDSLLGRKGGMAILCGALARGNNPNLETLRLQYNEIDGKGVGLLCDVLRRGALPALRRVELNGNKFSEDDARVATLRALLEERREEAGAEEGGAEWGLDEFSDLEEESEEEEEEEGAEDEEEEEEEAKAEEILRDAEEEEGRNVSQKQDKDVDALAERLGKTDMVGQGPKP